MWWIYALLSALFAALKAIFAKIGIKNVDSDLAVLFLKEVLTLKITIGAILIIAGTIF